MDHFPPTRPQSRDDADFLRRGYSRTDLRRYSTRAAVMGWVFLFIPDARSAIVVYRPASSLYKLCAPGTYNCRDALHLGYKNSRLDFLSQLRVGFYGRPRSVMAG